MIGEFDFAGVIVPWLLAFMVVTLPIVALLRRGLDAVGFYRMVWHRALFDVSLFVIVLGLLVLLGDRWMPR